jgi:DNA-binding CsgD family transcriptional regulator
LPHLSLQPKLAAIWVAYAAQAALARGDLTVARRLADDAVAATSGFHLSLALTTRAGVAIAQGEPEQADRDAHDALVSAVSTAAYAAVPETLECLAVLAVGGASHREATRLFGAADAIRQRGGLVRFKIFDAFFEFPIAALREAMGQQDFEAAWAEGVALSTDDAIAYARRGHGKRKRPTTGWAALTPTECDVVRLVSEGLANNDIATRLFVSPRTVQTHLTHVYNKLGLTSRVQLVQEAARHG